MDLQTLHTYEQHASTLCATYRQTVPTTLYTLIPAYFLLGQPTVDIGCGSGRDTMWLENQGYPTIGYDASGAMLREARSAYPGIHVQEASLPALQSIPDATVTNLLCNATLMHVPRTETITAVLNLARILQPHGRMIVTYRPSTEESPREVDGRLYTPLPAGKLILLLESAGLRILLHTHQADTTRTDITWTTLVVERHPLDVSRGLERIQSVLVQERKTGTHKFALIRAFCRISRTQAHFVHWENERVFVPAWNVAIQWIILYWAVLTHPTFIAQQRGERINQSPQFSLRQIIRDFASHHGTGGLYDLLTQIDTTPQYYQRSIRKIVETIKKGPITHTGGHTNPIFTWQPQCGNQSLLPPTLASVGWITVPTSIWLDISRFDHWIEESVLLRWAQFTASINATQTCSADSMLQQVLPVLLTSPIAERDTNEIRDLLQSHHTSSPLICAWSDAQINVFEVDHIIPYAVWANNDLWNLLPCRPQLNRQKRDFLPSYHALIRQKHTIISYWQEYANSFQQRFATQIERAMGCSVQQPGWSEQAFSGLQEVVEHLASTRGLYRWNP